MCTAITPTVPRIPTSRCLRSTPALTLWATILISSPKRISKSTGYKSTRCLPELPRPRRTPPVCPPSPASPARTPFQRAWVVQRLLAVSHHTLGPSRQQVRLQQACLPAPFAPTTTILSSQTRMERTTVFGADLTMKADQVWKARTCPTSKPVLTGVKTWLAAVRLRTVGRPVIQRDNRATSFLIQTSTLLSASLGLHRARPPFRRGVRQRLAHHLRLGQEAAAWPQPR